MSERLRWSSAWPKFSKEQRIHSTILNSSQEVLRKFRNPRYSNQSEWRGESKPRGMWYGFGDSWLEWVLSNEFRVDKYTVHYEVDVSRCNILHLSTYDELIEFTSEHNAWDESESFFSKSLLIDWVRVAERYDGIEINPYVYKARLSLETQWYYGWDVAGGCVWNFDKIKLIERR